MRPVDFAQQNITFLPPKDMENCESLPVYRDGREIISCWRFSFKDILKVIFKRRIWLHISGMSQPPVYLRTEFPFTKEDKNG